MAQADFEPKLLAFFCNWAGYAAADQAGVSRCQYLDNIRVIRVMCTGRVDPGMVVESFIQGNDGVMVVGCRFGECRYENGNYYAEKRMKRIGSFFGQIGISPERLFNDWLSSEEDEKLAGFITQFTKRLKELGPLGESEGLDPDELKLRLSALKEILSDERLRWLLGKELELADKENVFGEKITEEEFNQIVNESFLAEFNRKKILLSLKEKPMSVEAISQKLNLPANEVLRDVVVLNRQGSVMLDKVEDDVPFYIGVKT